MNINIEISDKGLNILSAIEWVMSAQCGGIDVFIGTVREITKEKSVIRLEFETYEKMALNEMRKIAEQAFDKWPVQKILIHHRKGVLVVGDVPVIIAVAAPHRDAAFEACRYIIDELKKTVPIWKKEVFADGEAWVVEHP